MLIKSEFLEDNAKGTKEYIDAIAKNFSNNPTKFLLERYHNIVEFNSSLFEGLKGSVLEFVNDPIKFLNKIIINIPYPTDSIDYSTPGIVFKKNSFYKGVVGERQDLTLATQMDLISGGVLQGDHSERSSAKYSCSTAESTVLKKGPFGCMNKFKIEDSYDTTNSGSSVYTGDIVDCDSYVLDGDTVNFCLIGRFETEVQEF